MSRPACAVGADAVEYWLRPIANRTGHGPTGNPYSPSLPLTPPVDLRFITASEPEIAALDGGAVNGAWTFEGLAFEIDVPEQRATPRTATVGRLCNNGWGSVQSSFHGDA